MSLPLLTLPTMKGGKTAKLSSLYCAIGLALMPAAALVSTPAYAQVTKKIAEQQFNIPAGTMAKTLRSFASQAGISISFTDNLVSKLSSKGLKGNYTIQAGLTKLLADTSLSFKASGKNAFIIEKRRINTLATAQVIDNSLGSNTEDTGSYTTGSMSSATGLNISMRETPQSVSVVTAQLMHDQDLRTLTDVIIASAGLSAKEKDSTRFEYSARGFDIDNYQIDGVTMPMSGGSGEPALSTAIYERIEIVRGATGLLTGAGSPSAAINLVRKRANSKEFTGSTIVGVGSWNNYNVMMDLSTPLNDDGSVRARMVVNYEDGDSYVDLASIKKSVFYTVIDTDLTENTLLSVGISYQDNQPTNPSWGGLPIWYSDGTRTAWQRSKTTSANWTYWDSTFKNYFLNISHEFSNNWKIKFNYNKMNKTLEQKLLYLSKTVDKVTGLGLRASPTKADSDSKQNDIGLHLSGTFQWIEQQHEVALGLTHSNFDRINNLYARDNIATPGDFNQWDGSYAEPDWGESNKNYDAIKKQTGFYAASRLSLTDSFKFIIGGRFSDWEETGVVWGKEVDYGDKGVFIPYAGLLYDLSDHHTAYASYTDIFKPQNKQDRYGDFLEPLKGKNYELGLKSEFFDGHLNTSAALFRIDQDNFAQKDKDHFVPGIAPPREASIALQGTISKGFEIEVSGELMPNWNLSLSYTQFTAENAEGEKVNTYQPNKLLKLYSSYSFSGDWRDLSIGGGINWQGSNHTELTNPVTKQDELGTQEAYALVSFMARYNINEQLTAQLNINNLLDKTYYSQIGKFKQYAYGKPRSVNLNLRYQF